MHGFEFRDTQNYTEMEMRRCKDVVKREMVFGSTAFSL